MVVNVVARKICLRAVIFQLHVSLTRSSLVQSEVSINLSGDASSSDFTQASYVCGGTSLIFSHPCSYLHLDVAALL